MRSKTETAATRPAERRRARKQLSKLDQDFLNLVRTRFRNHADRGRRMTSAELRRFLGIGNAYIARRLFAVLDDDRDGRVSETDFLKSVVSLILGEDEDKLRFIFRLHDDDADGKIDAHDLDHMLQACLSSNRIDISIQERHAIRDALLARGRRRALDFSAFRRLLAAHELVRRKLIQSVADWFGAEGRPRLDVRHVRFSPRQLHLRLVGPGATFAAAGTGGARCGLQAIRGENCRDRPLPLRCPPRTVSSSLWISFPARRRNRCLRYPA